MGVWTFSADWDRAVGKVLVLGNSSTLGNSALEVGDVEYVDNVAPDLVLVGLVLPGLQNVDLEFEGQVRWQEYFLSLQRLVFGFALPHF